MQNIYGFVFSYGPITWIKKTEGWDGTVSREVPEPNNVMVLKFSVSK